MNGKQIVALCGVVVAVIGIPTAFFGMTRGCHDAGKSAAERRKAEEELDRLRREKEAADRPPGGTAKAPPPFGTPVNPPMKSTLGKNNETSNPKDTKTENPTTRPTVVMDGVVDVYTEQLLNVRSGELPKGWRGDATLAVNKYGGRTGLSGAPKVTDEQSVLLPDVRIRGNFNLEVDLSRKGIMGDYLFIDLIGTDGVPTFTASVMMHSLDGWDFTLPEVGTKSYRTNGGVHTAKLQRRDTTYVILVDNKEVMAARLADYTTFGGIRLRFQGGGNGADYNPAGGPILYGIRLKPLKE